MSTESPTQVFIATDGIYSDYRILSVWLTREEAEAAIADLSDGQVEVWPIGDAERTTGTFTTAATIDGKTGAIVGEPRRSDGELLDPKTSVWTRYVGMDRISIKVQADTRERADKVFTEVIARCRADISTGIPPNLIAEGLSSLRADDLNPALPQEHQEP